MSRGINKVTIVGHLGKDPETKAMPSGSAVTNITVATTNSWKDKTSGEKQEQTEWHRIVFFNRLAEIAAQYLKKGSQVYVEGSLRTRKWQNKDGVDQYTTEIVASELQMLGNVVSATTSNGAPAANDQASQQRHVAGSDIPMQYGGGGAYLDDIPFAKMPYILSL